jgi:hypothetical protein
MRPPKLTPEQLEKLHALEPRLKAAAVRGDYKSAQEFTAAIQEILRPTGHETRLMQVKAWLFEAAMEARRLDIAEPGFIGIRKKVSKGSRLYIEATTLLAICYLRQKNLANAGPLIAEVLRSRNIRSESGRRQFLRQAVLRFEEEGLLAALVEKNQDDLDPEEIQDLAAELVRTKNEDEIFSEIGKALPPESVAFLMKVDAMAKRGLTKKEVLYLPGEAQILEKAELGRTTFRSVKRVLWNSLCNPESDIYKAWFSAGLNFVLDRKYLTTAITTTLLHVGIGIHALAVSFAALIMKFGIEVYCDRFKPDFIMEARSAH